MTLRKQSLTHDTAPAANDATLWPVTQATPANDDALAANDN